VTGIVVRRHFQSFALVLSCVLASVSAAKAHDAPVVSGVSADGKVHADMLSLKRTEGDTVTLRFAIVNDSNRTVSTTLGNMRLIDLVGRTSYEPGVTSSTCSAESGAKAICWAVFAAPGPNTKSINVKFYDTFELISTPIGG
jgi:hypothetical protein